MPIGRKTMAEIRAEERSRGFGECLRMFTDAWHGRVWEKAAGKQGVDAPSDFMWSVIEKAEKRSSELDLQYKDLALPRMYPGSYPDGEKPSDVLKGRS